MRKMIWIKDLFYFNSKLEQTLRGENIRSHSDLDYFRINKWEKFHLRREIMFNFVLIENS